MAHRTKMAAERWTPPPDPGPVRRRGDVRTLPELRRIELPGAGPEHIAVDAWGTLYTGLADGRIVRVTPEGEVRTVTNTGGRPLGLELYGEAGCWSATRGGGCWRCSCRTEPWACWPRRSRASS